MIQELTTHLMEKAGLTEEQATKAAQAAHEFITAKTGTDWTAKAKEMAGDAGDKISNFAAQAKDKAEDFAEDAGKKMHEWADKAGDMAEDAMDKLKNLFGGKDDDAVKPQDQPVK